jgi:hypothetical protein
VLLLSYDRVICYVRDLSHTAILLDFHDVFTLHSLSFTDGFAIHERKIIVSKNSVIENRDGPAVQSMLGHLFIPTFIRDFD